MIGLTRIGSGFRRLGSKIRASRLNRLRIRARGGSASQRRALQFEGTANQRTFNQALQSATKKNAIDSSRVGSIQEALVKSRRNRMVRNSKATSRPKTKARRSSKRSGNKGKQQAAPTQPKEVAATKPEVIANETMFSRGKSATTNFIRNKPRLALGIGAGMAGVAGASYATRKRRPPEEEYYY